MNEEQQVKENFMKLEGDLYDMREQIKFLENLIMFQKSASDAQKHNLLDMEHRVQSIELGIREYPLKIERSKLTSPPKESADIVLGHKKVSEIIFMHCS